MKYMELNVVWYSCNLC